MQKFLVVVWWKKLSFQFHHRMRVLGVTTKKMDGPSAQHFCKAGHNGHDLIALGLEHVRSRDPFILRAREHLLIKKFDSYQNGLNQEP